MPTSEEFITIYSLGTEPPDAKTEYIDFPSSI